MSAGTVYADPFPGYVHGKNPAVCRHGCHPVLSSTLNEDAGARLRREAVEFVSKFFHEMGLSAEVHLCLQVLPENILMQNSTSPFQTTPHNAAHRLPCAFMTRNHWHAARTDSVLLGPIVGPSDCIFKLKHIVQAQSKRLDEVLEEISKTGTYQHTFNELQWAIRVAWRNAAKCANRRFWDEIMLLDHRDADTPAGMFEVCPTLVFLYVSAA